MKADIDRPSEIAGSKTLRAGIWRLADPRISLASFSSIFLGACLASLEREWSLLWLGVAAVAVFAIEIAKNASGEIIDFDSGVDSLVDPADRTPFSGGKRVLVDGILTRQQTLVVALFGYAVGVGLGLSAVIWRQPNILWPGLAGVSCAYFYHGAPLKLSYRGFGELAVAVCYGPLLCAGTLMATTASFSRQSVLLSLPLGILIAAFLLVNEFPDAGADRSAGKRTLVVHLGRKRACWLFLVCMMAAFLFLAILPLLGLSWWVWLGFVALPAAAFAVDKVWKYWDESQRLVSGQVATLFTFLLYSLGTGSGLLLFGWLSG